MPDQDPPTGLPPNWKGKDANPPQYSEAENSSRGYPPNAYQSPNHHPQYHQQYPHQQQGYQQGYNQGYQHQQPAYHQQQGYGPQGGYQSQGQGGYPQQGGYYPQQQPVYVQQQPHSSGNADCLTACLAAMCICCTLDMLI